MHRSDQSNQYYLLFLLLSLVLIIRAAEAATGDPVLINEVYASHTGTDNTEYVELYGVPGTSLDGLSILVVESDDQASNGMIDRRFDFGAGDEIGINGFFLIGNPIGLNSNYNVVPDLDIASNYLENSSLTLALVETASVGAVNTLVTGGEIVLDSVALWDGDPTDAFFFNAPVVGPDGSFLPAGARRSVDGMDADTANDWLLSDFFLGADNSPTAGESAGSTTPLLVKIHEVQGTGSASPLDGDVVTVEGIVVGDFQNNGSSDNGNLSGFYLQEEDADADADPLTSEGIFIYDGSLSIDVSVGDRVSVTGEVSEFFNLTEISANNIAIMNSGEVLPAIVDLTLPVADDSILEQTEGMLVRFPQALVISEYFNFDRFGEIVLAQPLPGEQRPMTTTAMEIPGATEYFQRLDDNLRARITLDDGFTVQNPDPARHPNGNDFDLGNRFRGGDHVQNAVGIMDYRFSRYRIQPTQGADYIASNPRPGVPIVGGSLKVATFNVLNYFTTLDNGPDICGPNNDLGCRGADTAEEFTRQRDKIINALVEMDADVVGLVELENNSLAALQDLVSGLNSVMSAGSYTFVDTGSIGEDAIKVGFIYKPASVTIQGNFAVLDSLADPLFVDALNRPALAQTFVDSSNGAKFTAVVNHFKSKGSACDNYGDINLGDGQGNCNLTRTNAANALINWLATDPTSSGDTDVLILGDLNAYDKEDPIMALTNGGYIDLLLNYQGEEAYTYVFDGQFGYLDYALANQSMNAQVVDTTVWHINADEPDMLDYNMDFKKDAQDALYEPNAYRSSDHDPIIVGLNLNASPQCDAAVASQELLWPPNHELVPVNIVGVTDPDGDEVSISINSIYQDEPLNGENDGNTTPDANGVGTAEAHIRAERSDSEGADGRVYQIAFTASDSLGGQCAGMVTVGVPLNQGKNSSPVNSGANFESTDS